MSTGQVAHLTTASATLPISRRSKPVRPFASIYHEIDLFVLDQLETQVIGEIRDAVRQVRYQAEAVNAAGESLKAARRQLAAEEARYRNDLSTNFQVLEYQQTLVQAMNTEQTARVEFMKSLSQLEFAQGILGETGR